MHRILLCKSLISVGLLFAAFVLCPQCGWAQAVIFPQEQQPGAATFIQGNSEGVLQLKNDLLTATFINEGGKLRFGGCPELGLKSDTELFRITLGDETTVVPASAMTVKNWGHDALAGDPTATVASEKLPGQSVYANLSYGDLDFTWRAVLRDGSHYLRTELSLTAVKDVAMHEIIPMMYEINAADAPEVVGNTRGAILASSKIFAGLETPTAYNTVENITGGNIPGPGNDVFVADEGFKYNGWNADTSGDTQPVSPAYWTWEPGTQIPQGVKDLGFSSSDVRGKRGFVDFATSGQHTATFRYVTGTHRLNIIGADVVNADGEVVASDYHLGFTGGASSNNTYTLDIPEAGTYLVRYFVDIRTETVTSSGTVSWSPSVTAGTAPSTLPETSDEATKMIQGRWSRHATLGAGKTWEVSSVVGLIAPGQARRSVLAYSERERAVPWRAFPIYNSWYELNIDRNNSPTYTGHMTATDCANVVKEWKKNLYEQYDANIKSFVWDDGWDEYGTWDFNKNFPNGFTEPDNEAVSMHSGTGTWLGPVGGYGESGRLRREYWANNGGMQLSNPAYYTVFLNACNRMVDAYNFNFFKLDGISAQGNSVGPDPGYTGEENAEGIIDILSRVREIRPDMFFNTTVGTWASPFWFHYTDAVWRQDADHSTIGNQGDDRERWITYRDQLVYRNFVTNSPLCPINTLMTHGVILTEKGDVSKSMNYDGIVREIRCAFACGSGMVELYCDAKLLNTINGGALWKDIADCIKWQEKNADVLPDIHWVGGNPWDGAKANVYGWASWNGEKSTLALRNPSASQATYSFTLREALDIPDYVSGSVYLSHAFDNQAALDGLTTDEALDIDQMITVTMPASSVFVFDGSTTANTDPGVERYTVTVAETEHGTIALMNGETPVPSGRKVEKGTVIDVVATPDQGYMLDEISINGQPIEDQTFTVTETTQVVALFVRDPNVPTIYIEPDGNVRSDTYVKTVSTTGAAVNISKEYASLPSQVYNLIDDVAEVVPGGTFTLNLVANSLGTGSYSVVRQDLRYATAYIFVDWDGTADFTLDRTYGTLPPSHNVYGNYGEVMNIAHTLTMPASTPDGTLARVRVIYANAWTIPGEDESLSLSGHTSADASPNSKHITDGVAYDIKVKATGLGAIDQIGDDGADAPEELYNLQGIRVVGSPLSGIYLLRKGSHVSKIYIK